MNCTTRTVHSGRFLNREDSAASGASAVVVPSSSFTIMPPKPIGDPSEGASYSSVDASKIKALEIFPPVGIARLGDSEEEYFLAPEVPGNISPPTPDGNFRDTYQGIRRQVVSSIDSDSMIVLTIS
jgi:L-Lysine epsilon oxidase N-terminal